MGSAGRKITDYRRENAGSIRNAIIILGWLTLALPASGAAETKVFDHTVDQAFSGSQSPDDAYMAAMTKAKFEVLEQAGTYLESLTVVENAILSEDEVTALAGGVLTTEVVKKENYANDQTFGIILTTRIEVDTGVLHQRMDKLLQDRSLLRKYNEIREREQELLEKIRQLEAQNSNQAEQSTQPPRFDDEFTELSAALTASQWLEKAYALWTHGRFADPLQAIENLNRALALDDNNPHIFNSRAIAYLNLGKLKEAEEDLKKSLDRKKDYADAYNNLGSVYYRRGKYQEAVSSYTEAIKLHNDFTEAILNRGSAYHKLFAFEEAIEDFRRAMLLAPATFYKGENSGSLVELDDLDVLCGKARTACNLNLCRSLDFLRERGFCLEENSRDNNNP